MSLTKDVIIIGGGWSGLSAACYLTKYKFNIMLYESAKELGGRARTITINEKKYDNGLHLLINAYHETLNLMTLIDADIDNNLLQKPLKLEMRSLLQEQLILRTFNFPAPLHLFIGLITSFKLNFIQKIKVFYFFIKISNKSTSITDISVLELLTRYKQSKFLIETLWQPLCLAILNTPINQASANIFITVLQRSLLTRKNNSDFLFTSNLLADLLPTPAKKYIRNKIQLTSRVTDLVIINNAITGIIVNGNLVKTNHVILAIPPYACIKLISKHKKLETLEQQLSKFTYQPICTIYLQFPIEITLGTEMIGVLGTHIQWLLDRKIANQHGLIAAIISADGPHMKLDNEQLTTIIKSEINHLFPDWPAPTFTKIIREKRATFSCDYQISSNRPSINTAVKGLWICGDHTNTGLPATLEGAIISGKSTAEAINNYN